MSNISSRGRWAGVSGRSKVAALMAAAALGVAAATPWLFDDGTVEQTNISTGRNGGPRAVRRSAPTQTSGGKAADPGAAPSPSGSPLPVPGDFSELFDGGAPQQTAAAEGGGEAGPKAPDTVAGLEESDGAQGGGGFGMGGKVGVKPAAFGNAKGFVAEIRR